MWNGYTNWEEDNDTKNEINGLYNQISRSEEKIKELEDLIKPLQSLREENADDEELVCQELDRRIAVYRNEIEKLQNDIAFYQARINELEGENS